MGWSKENIYKDKGADPKESLTFRQLGQRIKETALKPRQWSKKRK